MTYLSLLDDSRLEAHLYASDAIPPEITRELLARFSSLLQQATEAEPMLRALDDEGIETPKKLQEIAEQARELRSIIEDFGFDDLKHLRKFIKANL